MFAGPTILAIGLLNQLPHILMHYQLTNSVFSFTDVIALPVGFSDHHIVTSPGDFINRLDITGKATDKFYMKLHSEYDSLCILQN